MQVLLTGVSGRVGQWVARELLAHGHQVRALDYRAAPEDLRGSVEMIYADIADPLALLRAVSGCDAIAHVAAIPNPGPPNAEMLRVNVIGTQNVLDAAAAEGISRVVLTSSVSALGFSFPTHPCLPDYLPVDAAHPRRPQDIYGVTKLMNEESAHAAHRLHGMTTIVLRPPAVFDLERARERGWLARMAERRGDEHDSSLWGYIDARDLAVAYRLALELELTGFHIFYAMADDLSVNATPVELATRHLPNLIADAERLPGGCFYDLRPARELLGFSATRTWRQALELSP